MPKKIEPELSYNSEKQFRAKYLKCRSKQKQVELIREYREWLSRLDEAKAALIKALAERLYTERTQHFFLELLQNADDNRYSSDVEPTIEFEYQGEDTLIIRNNELGFSAEDVYSITTAALSTKYLVDDSAYIGEKGIGFKSVFAVADEVEIHSNGYHFALKNGEYIIPYWIEEPYDQLSNTEIVLHLKPGRQMRQMIADNLRELSRQTLGMILFLHKLKCIRIIGAEGDKFHVRLKDAGKYRELYTDSRMEARFFVYSYKQSISTDAIKNRYADLYRDGAVDTLTRDIVMAVPDPTVMDLATFKGFYFAYLQTNMQTGLKMHIQIDAETTTNREQYTLKDESLWNAKMLACLEQEICALYLRLREEPTFKDCLPEYFPKPGSVVPNANADAASTLAYVCDNIAQLPLFLNMYGVYSHLHEVIIIHDPDMYFLYDEAKYVAKIKNTFPDDIACPKGISFLDKKWMRMYKKILESYGMYATEPIDVFIFLTAGPPKTVKINNYESVSEFNRLLHIVTKALGEKSFLDIRTRQTILSALIFPVTVQKKGKFVRAWATANQSKDLRWQDVGAKSSRPPSRKYLYIDAEFTYRPGGGTKNRETVQSNNSQYRSFLRTIGITQHSLLQTIMDAHVLPLYESDKLEPGLASKLLINIYNEYWMKKSLMERETNDIRQEFLALLPKCNLPVMLADNSRKLTTMPASECYVAETFLADKSALFKSYFSSAAPIVHLEAFSPKAKVDWNSWRDFLINCFRVKTGPYWVKHPMHTDMMIGKRSMTFIVLKDLFSTYTPFFREIGLAIYHHEKHKDDDMQAFISFEDSDPIQTLDKYSLRLLLGKGSEDDYLARCISIHMWKDIEWRYQILAEWKYFKNRTISVKNGYFEEFILRKLVLKDSCGKPVNYGDLAFISSSVNRKILGNYGIYVNEKDYGSNQEFLDMFGIHREVSANNILDIHHQQMNKLISSDIGIPEYEAFLRIICAYQKSPFLTSDLVAKTLQLWNPAAQEKQTPRIWIHDAHSNGFSLDLVSDIKLLFVDKVELSAEELLDRLFEETHVLDSHLKTLISGIGVKVPLSIKGYESIVVGRMHKDGITIAGNCVNNSKDLPTVWIANLGFRQSDAELRDVWVHAPDAVNDSFLNGLAIVGWPTSETLPVTVSATKKAVLSASELQNLNKLLVTDRTEDIVSGREPNATMQEIHRLLKGNAITICRDLQFCVGDKALPVKYALHGTLYLENSVEPLFDLLYNLGGGVVPKMMLLLWSSLTDASSTHREAQDADARDGRDSGTKQGASSQTGKASDNARDHRNHDNVYGSAYNERSGTQSGDNSQQTGKPYAFFRTGIYASEPCGTPNDTKHETGRKGVRIVKEEEERNGKNVELMPDNFPGYDIISSDEAGRKYIEVKTITGTWELFLLTKTEYQAAQQLMDDYLIYVVELLDDNQHRITRIQNPIAKITHYSFDSGWRIVENPHMPGTEDEYDDLYKDA